MPLIPQQDVIVVEGLKNGSAAAHVEALRQKLDAYPPCRIISISVGTTQFGGVEKLVAVVESV